jgi:REP-associated tyrosine transposase
VLHVTLRFCADLPTLRKGVAFIKVRQALLESARGPCVDKGAAGFRLAHFSIQHDHLHLVVEASNWRCLSRGMHALKVRLARSLNGALARRGPVFTERYHARRLRSPTEVRNGLCYVLNNARRHRGRRSQPQPGWIDPCSSGCWFDGWRCPPPQCPPPQCPPPQCAPQSCPLPAARTWLLAKGWRRGARGLLATDEVPGGQARRKMQTARADFK